MARCPRESLSDLPGKPDGSRVRRRRHEGNSPSIEREDDKRVELSKAKRRNGQEIDRRYAVDLVRQKGAPTLTAVTATDAGHVFGDRRFGDIDPKLQEFTVNARRTPEHVLARPRA